MKLSKKILAMLLAMAMVFSFAACNGNDDDNDENDENGQVEDQEKNNQEDNDDEDKDDEWYVAIPESEEFDFGVLAFNARDFIVMAGTDIKIGGNKGPGNGEGGGASDAISILGLQGYGKPDEGYPGDDPEGEWQTLVAQNGEFWDNISHIEASFFLEGAGGLSPEEISNVEVFLQGGELLKYDWVNPGDNLLWEFDEENGGNGFKWGNVMTAVWDITAYKEGLDEAKAAEWSKPSTFDDAGNEPGGGLLKIGLQIQTDNVIDNIEGRISWTDAKIYVYDLEKFNAFVERITEITGKTMSANTTGKVIEVE